MTQSVDNPAQWEARRHEWLERVASLLRDVTAWSEAEAWDVERSQHQIHERFLGDYDAPALRVQVPGGELLVTPVALHVAGGEGRVDLEAIPTLSRVKLIGVRDGWRIMTDSNVPLRRPWDRDTFTELVRDMLS